MKLGLIARDEIARGLAIQSKNFYDNMPVDKVLVVDMPRPDCAKAPEWYPGAWHIGYDAVLHRLDEAHVRDWMSDLDVIFTVETPYDWRLPEWARSMGVKTVIQGNPEFYRHNLPGFEHQAHPDAWWWPTRWRLASLPAGQVIPVPMPDNIERTAGRRHDPFVALHVAGKRAWLDRNGTDIFCSALANCMKPIVARIHGIDEELPRVLPRDGVTVESHPSAIDDRWQMYDGAHLLVLPRKYGGLCLPALEAAACGLGVMMTDCPPNAELASELIPARSTREINLACGQVTIHEVSQIDLGKHLDWASSHPDEVARMQSQSYESVPRWSQWRDRYLTELEGVCQR